MNEKELQIIKSVVAMIESGEISLVRAGVEGSDDESCRTITIEIEV